MPSSTTTKKKKKSHDWSYLEQYLYEKQMNEGNEALKRAEPKEVWSALKLFYDGSI